MYMYKRIYNPNTLKPYTINSKQGKNILKKYLVILNGGANPDSMGSKGTACMLFGRFQPPHQGHGELLDFVIETAKSQDGTAFLFTSQKDNNFEDPKKIKSYRNSKSPKTQKQKLENPIKIADKLSILEKLHGHKDIEIVDVVHEEIKNPFQAVDWLRRKGYSKIVFMAGTDRFTEYTKSFLKYPDIEVLELERPESGISGTGVRNLALDTLVKNIEKLEHLYDFSKNMSETDIHQLENTMELYAKIKGQDQCHKNIETIIKLIRDIKSEDNCQDNIELVKKIVDLIYLGTSV
jgi:hypothetical protein